MGATRRKGEEENFLTDVHGQDLNDCGKTGGVAQESIFCTHPDDTRKEGKDERLVVLKPPQTQEEEWRGWV